MFLSILTLIIALTISGVAIYYSVAGLVAIFAAAALPIIIMGGALEIGKLVTAVWLHKHWQKAVWWLKSYLAVAVVVLMFITSMGIFGFLSKAHIEQTSMSQEQVALIKTLNDKITRSEAKIQRWTTDLGRLNKGEDVRVDNLIDREQDGLDKIYARIKNEKDGLRADAKIKVDQQQLRITQAQERRDKTIEAAEKKFKESFAGSEEYEAAVAKAKQSELSVASRAQKEILKVNEQLDNDLKAVDTRYAEEIASVQKRIQDLRNQANNKTEDIDARVSELEGYIEAEQKVIDDVREEKFGYEKEYRKLEAEVGPIKYIAEFIYGENANNDLLEEAVRWVIITIIFVFDPLAVLLLIASQYSFGFHRQSKISESPKPDPDTDPSGSDPDSSKLKEEPEDENDRTETTETLHEGTETDSEQQTGESGEEPRENDPVVATVEDPVDEIIQQSAIEVLKEIDDLERANQKQKDISDPAPRPTYADLIGETYEGKADPVENNNDDTPEVSDGPVASDLAEPEVQEDTTPSTEGTSVESTETVEDNDSTTAPKYTPKLTEEELELLEESEEWQEAKRRWKHDHPEETLKEYKRQYFRGHIERLPWEDYLEQIQAEREEQQQEILATEDESNHETTSQSEEETNSESQETAEDVEPNIQLQIQPNLETIETIKAQPDVDAVGVNTDFGTSFPTTPTRGDLFMRVDFLPSKMFKYIGDRWIEVDKGQTDTYVYNEEYIDYLISKLGSGEYDPELLTPSEKDLISERLKQGD